MGDENGHVGVVPEGTAALAKALSDLHARPTAERVDGFGDDADVGVPVLGPGPWTPSNFAPLALDRRRWLSDQAVAMKRRADPVQELRKQTAHGLDIGTAEESTVHTSSIFADALSAMT